MKLSSLQLARYQYNPKLPGMLRNGISEICVKNGGATQSVLTRRRSRHCSPTPTARMRSPSRRARTPAKLRSRSLA